MKNIFTLILFFIIINSYSQYSEEEFLINSYEFIIKKLNSKQRSILIIYNNNYYLFGNDFNTKEPKRVSTIYRLSKSTKKGSYDFSLGLKGSGIEGSFVYDKNGFSKFSHYFVHVDRFEEMK
jgi:hypothetical protein